MRIQLSFILAILGGGSLAAEDIVVAGRGAPPLAIVVEAGDTALQSTSEWCREFFVRRGYTAAIVTNAPGTGTVLRLRIHTARNAFPTTADDETFLRHARADAFVLDVRGRGGPAEIVISALGAAGVRSGVARLVAVCREDGERIYAPAARQTLAPFFPIRRLHVCVTGRIAQSEPFYNPHTKVPRPDWRAWGDTLWTKWSDERLSRYAEQIWLMGFNSIELMELRGYRGVLSDENLAREVTPKVRAFMRAAKEHGLQVSQFIWGQSIFKEGVSLCWNDPGERARMQTEFRRLAATYGDLVDHIVVHVSDPGGCDRNGCDSYRTPQEIAVYVDSEYRKKNPRLSSTINAWANEGFFAGEAASDFLDESLSPRSMGIALHRWYDGGRARLIGKSSRPVDIWGWYLGDYEMQLDLHLFMRRLDGYFSKLPKAAEGRIRAISTELNFSGWPQLINAYVSAQKMWDPRRSLDEIEREFCAGLYGEANADAVLHAYRASEKNVDPSYYGAYIPTSDCLPYVLGSTAYNAELAHAVERARTVTFSPDWRPRLGDSTPPAQLFQRLYENLQLAKIVSETRARIDQSLSRNEPASLRVAAVNTAKEAAQPLRNDPDYFTQFRELEERAHPRVSGDPTAEITMGFDNIADMRIPVIVRRRKVAPLLPDATLLIPGIWGQALRVEGAPNQRVEIGRLGFDGPATVSMWVKPRRHATAPDQNLAPGPEYAEERAAGKHRLISQLDGPRNSAGALRLDPGGVEVWDGHAWQRVIAAPLRSGRWNHLAVVYDAELNATGYLNGKYAGRVRAGFDFRKNSLGIASPFLGTHGHPLNGGIDEFRIYRAALTAGQIKAIFVELDELVAAGTQK